MNYIPNVIFTVNEYAKYSESQKIKHFTVEHPLHRTISDYEIVQKLGEGSFGEAILVKDLKNYAGYCVLKKIKYGTSCDVLTISQEIKSLQKLDHPNIVKYFNMFVDNNYVWFSTEYCDGGTIGDWIISSKKNVWPIPLNVINDVFTGCFFAMKYMHGCGIIHRDLKPANIFLSYDHRTVSSLTAKIGDLGLAYNLSNKMHASTLGGTIQYWAPEIVFHHKLPNKCTDVYAMGVVLFEVCTGKQGSVLLDNTKRDTALNQVKMIYGQEMHMVISGMTRHDPQFRVDFTWLSS